MDEYKCSYLLKVEAFEQFNTPVVTLTRNQPATQALHSYSARAGALFFSQPAIL